MSNDLEPKVVVWKKTDEELDGRIADFERKYRHTKPCKRYLETGYCVHLVNAQERKFGKDVKGHLESLWKKPVGRRKLTF